MTGTKKKVLLIDDDPTVCSALMMLLKDEFDAHAVGTVNEGVRLFGRLQPSVVILDLHLPDNHGLEALRSIRQLDRAAPVVILTGFATLETVEESLRLGANDCLHKPFDANVLVNRLRELSMDTDARVGEAGASYGTSGELEADDAPNNIVTSSFLHDVSNPLTSLSAAASLLRDGVDDPKRRERLLDMIEHNVTYMSSLLEQWRAFSEPESLDDDYGNLDEIGFHATELVKLRAEAKNVSISAYIEDGELKPKLNRHAVVRILVNLLQNSVEAVQRDSGEVEFGAKRIGDQVEFSVKDNGVGIAPDATQEIFQPRYTTKKKGKGLGLFIARRIVESANGSISICSRPGRGTTFKVQLPAC